jgi:hypothetical protein
MTPEERAADIMSRYKSGEFGFSRMLDWLGSKIEAAITDAVAEERERCAKLAEAFGTQGLYAGSGCGGTIAGLIRLTPRRLRIQPASPPQPSSVADDSAVSG